jgi:hypothetical protein
MGKEKAQPTLIDKRIYERFKNYVEDIHGHTHGHLKTEIENALCDYMQSESGEARMARMENDIATVISMLDEAKIRSEMDGGTTTDTRSNAQDARARENSKPRANQPRKDKIDYIITELMDKTGCTRQSGEVPISVLTDTIQTEYNFKSSTITEYKNQIQKRLDANEHPKHGKTIAWGQRYEDIVDELREQADEEMNDL